MEKCSASRQGKQCCKMAGHIGPHIHKMTVIYQWHDV